MTVRACRGSEDGTGIIRAKPLFHYFRFYRKFKRICFFLSGSSSCYFELIKNMLGKIYNLKLIVMSTEIGNISCINVICRKTVMNLYNYSKEVTFSPLRKMFPMLLDITLIKKIYTKISLCSKPIFIL